MRIRSLALILVVASAVFAAGCGDSSSTDEGSTRSKQAGPATEDERDAPTAEAPDAPDVPKVEPPTREFLVERGVVVGGPQQVPAKVGEEVVIDISSDIADEAHLHGIDATVKVPAGQTATLRFTPTDPGSYELEMHESGAVLGSVLVS